MQFVVRIGARLGRNTREFSFPEEGEEEGEGIGVAPRAIRILFRNDAVTPGFFVFFLFSFRNGERARALGTLAQLGAARNLARVGALGAERYAPATRKL